MRRVSATGTVSLVFTPNASINTVVNVYMNALSVNENTDLASEISFTNATINDSIGEYFGTDNDLPQRDRSSPKDLPIDTTLQLIAVYWKKMFASVGEIWHKQEADRFIIEYVGVNALNGSFPQSYQVLLYFDTGKIEMKFFMV